MNNFGYFFRQRPMITKNLLQRSMIILVAVCLPHSRGEVGLGSLVDALVEISLGGVERDFLHGHCQRGQLQVRRLLRLRPTQHDRVQNFFSPARQPESSSTTTQRGVANEG